MCAHATITLVLGCAMLAHTALAALWPRASRRPTLARSVLVHVPSAWPVARDATPCSPSSRPCRRTRVCLRESWRSGGFQAKFRQVSVKFPSSFRKVPSSCRDGQVALNPAIGRCSFGLRGLRVRAVQVPVGGAAALRAAVHARAGQRPSNLQLGAQPRVCIGFLRQRWRASLFPSEMPHGF